MNIFICGKNNKFSRLIAERLEKEKNEIYYLSGARSAETLSAKVFQQYNFEYTNPNINRIVAGARSDVLIIEGAHDRNYPWRIPEKDSVSFLSGLTALLTSAKYAGVRQIIYLSSIEIFENNNESPLKTTVPEADSLIRKTFMEAETLCRSFADDSIRVSIIRMPCVFGFFDDSMTMDHCLMTANRYLEKGPSPAKEGNSYACIYYSDAVEAIVRLAKSDPSDSINVFQLQGIVYTETQLRNAIKASNWFIENTDTTSHKESADEDSDLTAFPESDRTNTAYTCLAEKDDETLGAAPKSSFDSYISLLCKDCMKHRKQTDNYDGRHLKVLPFIEAIIGALLAFIAAYLIKDNWVGAGLDPFIIYVVLFGAVYGIPYGLFTSVLSIIGVFLIKTGDTGFFDTIRDGSFFIQFLEYVLSGVISGFMHDKFNRKNHNLEEERAYLSSELEDITIINDDNIYVKNIYEKRLIGYQNSISSVYRFTEELDALESKKVIVHAVKVVKELLNFDDAALYIASRNSQYFRLAAATSEKAQICGKSLLVDENFYLYKNLMNHEVYRNRDLKNDAPVFASGVYDDSGELISIIMVWTNNIHLVNLYESNMLAIISRLISRSMVRAKLFEERLSENSNIGNTAVLTGEAFNSILLTYRFGARQGLINYTLLKVSVQEDTLSKVQNLVRITDTLGFSDGLLYIILPFSSEADAQIVIDRFSNNSFKAQIVYDDINNTACGVFPQKDSNIRQ